MEAMQQRVIIGDSSPIYKAGVKKFFNGRREQPLYADSLKEVGQYLKAHGPVPVVLTDAFVAERSISCIMQLKNAVRGVKIIIHSERFSPDLKSYFAKGADTIVGKSEKFGELMNAVYTLYEMKEPYASAAIKPLLESATDANATEEHVLNEKEKELVLMTMEHASDKAIGEKLCIAENTVSKYRCAIYKKIVMDWGYKNPLDYVWKKRLCEGRY